MSLGDEALGQLLVGSHVSLENIELLMLLVEIQPHPLTGLRLQSVELVRTNWDLAGFHLGCLTMLGVVHVAFEVNLV